MKKRPKASWRMFRYTTEVHDIRQSDWTKYTRMLHETGAIRNVLADKDDDK
jgi:hypothetical protein